MLPVNDRCKVLVSKRFVIFALQETATRQCLYREEYFVFSLVSRSSYINSCFPTAESVVLHQWNVKNSRNSRWESENLSSSRWFILLFSFPHRNPKMNSFDTSDAEFQRHSQFISSSVQKIYQNGNCRHNSIIYGNFHLCIDLIGLFLVSSLNRMVNQVGTAQETPEIRQQLWVAEAFVWITLNWIVEF